MKEKNNILEKPHTNYPSRYKIKEAVDLDFMNSKYLKGCTIEAVRFTESKVMYDIRIPVGFEDGYTIVENVDSCFVRDPS